MISGYSHLGLATHDMEATTRFYEQVLGFPRVAEHRYDVEEGGSMRMAYFDLGGDQFLVFMAPTGIAGIPADFDTGINAGLGVPRGIYHLAFRVASMEDLHMRQLSLQAHGVAVSAVVDLGHAQSIFFRDPNGIELECCYHCRPFGPDDLLQEQKVSVAFRRQAHD
jgi:catechol 2,3-dioxygenase-like lactoylglutathione lyase family enzyme